MPLTSRCTRLLARFRLSPDVLQAHCASAASRSAVPRQGGGPLYEFRTYQIHPDRCSAFLKLTDEKIHLRTAHSELIGYWSVEYGALNQVFHIWKYESFGQRAAVRAALARDERWIQEYVSRAIPMLARQDNQVASLLPWSRICAPPHHGGAFELASFRIRPGGAGLLGAALRDGLEEPRRAHLVAAFHSDVGQLDTVYALRWFESADERRPAESDTAVLHSLAHVESRENKVLFPCSFSPLK
ncbi:protein NipSnap homolog 3A [Syngnathoides biaculeatus]|uniref:protein NipSnap homolog 3A n=1 Tax=Syngnathoides biaculeatus TaxID=300417 RepID=UPI002ADD575B|nr:protein NipSnap homolog 3A [Syngnathoides biaculeatus]